MDTNKEDSEIAESVHCDVCNVFMDCNAYNFHIVGKKHKKNASKSQKLVQKRKEPLVCQPQFVFEELAPFEIQFMSFLNQVLLSQEECSRTTSRILHDLEPCLTREFERCLPYIFGSMTTGLALIGSDVDIFLDTGIYSRLLTSPNPKEDLKRVVTRCARALRRDRRFTQVIPISMARVPIVKFLHQPTGVSCDISFKDSLGVHNSHLLQFYLSLNPRFFEVMVAIKFWAKENDFCKCDGISSYGWTLLFISFLQTIKFPNGDRLVPSVYDLQKEFHSLLSIVNGWRVDFHPKQNFVMLPNEPQFSHFGLLKGFFNYYKNFAFEENIVCPYLGQPIPWSSVLSDEAVGFPLEFQWYHNQLKTYLASKDSPRHSISLQDPFQHDFLLGGSCSSKKFEKIVRGLHAATKVCDTEEKLADPNVSMFLTSLFTSQPHVREDKIKIKLREFLDVKSEVLCEHVFVMLENIFTKVIKLELKVRPEACLRPQGEPERKVVKKAESQDVHQINDALPMEKKYDCVAVHPVWCYRKKLRKEVKLEYSETAFEFQTKLSDVIVKHNYPSERIEFSCDVHLSESFVVVVILRQSDKQHKNISNDLFQFLRNMLPGWLNTFLDEEFHEPAVSALIPSEPCTSKGDVKVASEGEDSENGDIVRYCLESGTAFDESNSSLEAINQKQDGRYVEQDS